MAGAVFELAEQMRRKVQKLVASSEPLRHLVNAKKEVLLAVRALIDAKIECLDKLLQPPEEPAGREVPVE